MGSLPDCRAIAVARPAKATAAKAAAEALAKAAAESVSSNSTLRLAGRSRSPRRPLHRPLWTRVDWNRLSSALDALDQAEQCLAVCRATLRSMCPAAQADEHSSYGDESGWSDGSDIPTEAS
jgi:hypothetical protein